MASGTGGQIALLAVGSLYQAVTSSTLAGSAHWMNFVSEDITHTIEALTEGAITGYRARPPSHEGLTSAAGNIQLEPNPNALGHALRGAFGQSSGTVLTAAGSWGVNSVSAQWAPAGYTAGRAVMQHRFVPSQTSFDERTHLPPYAVMVYKDVGSAFLFEGSIFPSLEIQIEAKMLAKATMNVMARNPTRISRSTSVAALRNPGGVPWVWDMASIQTGPGMSSLAADANFESLTIKYETPIEGVVLLDGTKRYGEYQANGFQGVDISGTISFRDQLDYDAFLAYNTRALKVTMTNARSDMVLGNTAAGSSWAYTLDMEVPAMRFTQLSTPVRGPNRLTSTFQAVGEFDVGSLYAIQAVLTNTTSSYP